MICELTLIAGFYICPADIKRLEVPKLSNDKCIVLTHEGRRYNMPMPCGEVYEKIVQLSEEEEVKGWGV